MSTGTRVTRAAATLLMPSVLQQARIHVGLRSRWSLGSLAARLALWLLGALVVLLPSMDSFGAPATPPTVTGVSPTAGETTGGTTVTITGTGFEVGNNGNLIYFGTAQSGGSFCSSTSCTTTSPAGTGIVDVTVTTSGGTSATSSADLFTYDAALTVTVTGISPTAGPMSGGTIVTITGTELTADSTFNFGAEIATGVSCSSSTSCTATSPSYSGLPAQTVDVTVTNLSGFSATSSADQFTYGPPTVTGISPSSGPTTGGRGVTITGAGFTPDSTVDFGGVAATSVSCPVTTDCTAESPAGTGIVDVTVSTPGGTSATSSADEFTYLFQSPPTISPSSLTIAPLGKQQFTATGGSGNYTWTFLFPPEGSGSNASMTTSGAYQAGSGSPTFNAVDFIGVTDTTTGLSSSEVVTVTESLTLSPTSASVYPGGTAGFTAQNGSGTYTWSLPSPGSGSPSVSPTNAATTTYTAGNTPSTGDTVLVTDSFGATAQATVAVGLGITISVNSPVPPASVPPLGTASLSATGGDSGPYTWTVTTNNSVGATVTSPNPPGTSATYTAGSIGGQSDTITVTDTHGNSATVQIAVGNGVSISPTDQSVAPLQTLTFGASGGSNTGFVFAFATPADNQSGGSLIGAAYKGGAKGNTTDTVSVTDSLGNKASTQVNVGKQIAITGGGASTPPLGGLQFGVSGGYATGGYTWSLSVDESGAGSGITSSGLYTAGIIGGAKDAITVTDTLGNSTSVYVTTTAGVSLTPSSITLPPQGPQTFVASGGIGGPYTWTMVQSPSGGGVDSSGNYKAGTKSGVNDIVQAKDSLGNTGTASITVGPGVSITPTSPSTPPKGKVPLTATGGSGVYTWLVTTNSSIGATVDASGTTVNYTAGATGSVSDVVTVTDSDGNTATVSISVGGGITLNPNSPSAAPRGSITFTATNGNGAPYTWSIVSTTGGTIAGGAYTAGSVGNSFDIVTVTDSLGNTASTTVTITAGLSLKPASATLAPLGTQSFSVTGGSGSGYVWTMQSAPSGGNVAGGNYVAGTIGSVTDVVLVTDNLLNTTTASITVTPALALSPTLPTTTPRGPIAFGATGGATPYTWSIQTNGSGANINSSTGAYTAGSAGVTSDTVLVTDNNGATVSTIVTVSAGVSITPATPSAAPLGPIPFSASGGSGKGFTWAITSNHSGGSIVAGTGAYTAGATGNSNDTVTVTDSLLNTATVSVSVGGGVAISPFSPTIPPQGSQTFTATGGSGAGFTWKLATSASGGTVNASTGAYKAGTTGSTTDTLQVTDSLGNTTSTPIHVSAGITISPASTTVAPLGYIGFNVAGGSGSGYLWSMQSAPSGGGIAGTGQYQAGVIGGVIDSVIVTDSLGNTATATVTVTVAISLAPATSSVAPKGTVAFKASGGTGQYFFTMQTNASGGSIAGSTGAYVAGNTPNVTDIVLVLDGNGATATARVNVGPAVTIAPANPAVAPLGKLAFTAGGGSGTGFAWSLTGNQSGGSITAGGAYTAGATAKSVDVVRVVDSLGNTATATISVGGGLAINPTNPSAPPRGAVAFTAIGGSGGYAWTLVTSASGGTINAGTGAYTAGSTGSVTDVVQVTDSNGNTATTSVKVGPGITVSPATVTVTTGVGLPFGVQGGSGSGYVWALTTNASGGTINAGTGAYVAGNTGGVTDVVGVTDSLGNTGSATVTVKGGGHPGGDGGVDSGADGGGGGDASSSDAASGHDGSSSGSDSGFAFDGSEGDSAVGSSSGGSHSGGGCGCTVVYTSASNLGGALGALLGLALVARRRRKR